MILEHNAMVTDHSSMDLEHNSMVSEWTGRIRSGHDGFGALCDGYGP